VVASGVGGLLDFVIDGDNGTLCQPQDPAALAIAIRALVADDGFRQRAAARARASVVDQYDEQKVFARFAKLLQDVVSSAARPA